MNRFESLPVPEQQAYVELAGDYISHKDDLIAQSSYEVATLFCQESVKIDEVEAMQLNDLFRTGIEFASAKHDLYDEENSKLGNYSAQRWFLAARFLLPKVVDHHPQRYKKLDIDSQRIRDLASGQLYLQFN